MRKGYIHQADGLKGMVIVLVHFICTGVKGSGSLDAVGWTKFRCALIVVFIPARKSIPKMPGEVLETRGYEEGEAAVYP